MADQLQKFDIGSTFRVTVKENGVPMDLSAAVVKNLKLGRPTGSVLEVPMGFLTDGADGVVIYTTVENDLDQTGPWKGQVFLEFGNGKWHTTQFGFDVGENL